MKAAGFGAIFCNIGDHEPADWDIVRRQAANAGVVCGPWLRTITPGGGFSTDKFNLLLIVADAWQAPCIVNSESELKGSGDKITRFMANVIGRRDVAFSVECWPFSNVEWWVLNKYPVLPQLFPQEAEVAKHPEDVKSIWHQYGMNCVVLTFGSYGGIDPNTFNRMAPYGVYTADDCGGEFYRWSPQGTYDPCLAPPVTMPKPPEEIMAQIGSQHGITAFVDWLQKQPGIPGRGPNYKKEDLSTWPWPEKLERTLNMLREDHDKRVPN